MAEETKKKTSTTKKTTKPKTSDSEAKVVKETKTVKKEKEVVEAGPKLTQEEILNIISDDEEDNESSKYIELIEVKSQNQSNVVAEVVDNETSSVLKELKKKTIANKDNGQTISSEELDKQQFVDSNELYKGVERFLDTDLTVGLTTEQVNQRISEGLTNKNDNDQGKSYLKIVLTNIFTFFNILYFIITVILIWVGEADQLIFLAVVIPNIVIGLVQEINSKRTVDKLKLMSAPVAIVIRNGEKLEIPVNDVVLDDIIMYTSGKQICADSIVLDGVMEVNEALLTGEADAINKTHGSTLMGGSFVSSGTCVARVDKVGKDCYISKMSNEAKKYNMPKSELLKTLNGVIRIISIILVPMGILYMVSRPDFNFVSGFNFESIKANILSLKSYISEIAYIILAMIPAGLYLLTSVALGVGVMRLARNKTLVQQLYCIEMLARVNVLCLDKTGTITDGTMRVCDCVEINNHTDYTIREIVGSMMYAFKETNMTSEALIRYFDKNNVLQAKEVIPFSSKRKFSAVTFENDGTFIIGAPDFVIKNNYDKIASKVTRFANQGCRVLVLGHIDGSIKNDELPKTVKPVSLIVIQDHIREDAIDTISFFKQNGVMVKVISGDNPETVSKIADRVGIENADRFINLNGLSDEEVKDAVFDYTIFGRVSPSQKKLIVQTLKENGKIVAMTGDGVNDIPALKEADCSIAMASGSEATRYVSHLVLMDSNFSSMPKVVNEGRRVINNIQKASSLYLSKNLFAFLIAIMYIIVGFISKDKLDAIWAFNNGFPFKPRNLFLIETIILGVGTFCLSIQPNRDIVKGKFIKNVVREILPGALTILLFQLILFFTQMIRFKGDYSFLALAYSPDQIVFSTISAIITTVIMLYVFYKACKPFNWYRKIVFSIVFVIIILMFTIPNLRSLILLDFTYFSITEWLLMIILLFAISPVVRLVRMLLVYLRLIPDNDDIIKIK